MSIIRHELIVKSLNSIELIMYETNASYKYFFYKQIENDLIKFETIQYYYSQLHIEEVDYLVTNNVCVLKAHDKFRNTVLLELTSKSLLGVL